MNRIYFILLSIFLFPFLSFGQTDSLKIAKPKTENVFGLNMTPLIMRLVPFQTPSPKTGPYNFQYKSYDAKGRDAILLQLGLNFDGIFVTNSNNHFNFRVAWERRKSLSERWKLLYGTGLMLFAGSLNIPTAATNNITTFLNGQYGIGSGTSVGIEYYPIPQLSIGTESILFFGLATQVVQIIPPFGITLNAHIK